MIDSTGLIRNRDSGIAEEIRDLRIEASALPPEGWQAENYLNALADEKQFRLSEFAAIRAKVLPIANRHKAEKEKERAAIMHVLNSEDAPLTAKVWRALERGDYNREVPDPARLLEAGLAYRYIEPQQKLNVWKAELLDWGLLTPQEANSINWFIPRSPAALEQARKDQQDHQQLIDARNYILAAAADRWEALKLYNMDEAPLSEGKLDTWIQRCVSAGLLGLEWLAGRKLGGALHKLLHGEAKHGTSFK